MVALTLISAVADSWSLVALSNLLRHLSDSQSTLWSFLWAFALAIALSSVARFSLHMISQIFSQFACADLMVAIQSRALGQPFEAHFARHSADLIAAPSKVEQTMFGVVMPLVQAGAAALSAVFILATLVWLNAGVALLALAGVAAVFGALVIATRKLLAAKGTEAAAAYADRVRAIQDSMAGIRDIILDGSGPAHVDRLRTSSERLAQAGTVSSVVSAAPRALLEMIGIVAVALVAVTVPAGRGGLGSLLPMLGALALAGQRLLPSAQALFQAWSSIGSNRQMLDDVAELLAVSVDTSGAQPAPPLPFRTDIQLEGVSYRYPSRHLPAIEDISLVIAKGERLIVSGPSGAGKTTLSDVIMGLVKASSGRLTVDRNVIDAANIRSWQAQIAHVPQFPFLADASIAANVHWNPGTTRDDQRVWDALQSVGLADFVRGMDGGADTMVGEHGIRLSGGQRQRLCLARAMYRNPSLLVLDEATNALDAESEAAIAASLDRLQQAGTTIVVISHHGGPATWGHRLIRLDHGRLVEELVAPSPAFEHEDRP